MGQAAFNLGFVDSQGCDMDHVLIHTQVARLNAAQNIDRLPHDKARFQKFTPEFRTVDINSFRQLDFLPTR